MIGSSMDRGVSQGKYNLVNGSSRFLRVMRWTSILRMKSRVKGNQESFIICNSQKRDLKYDKNIKRQSIDRVNHKFYNPDFSE